MTVFPLVVLAVVFILLAGVLTAAESAFSFLPRHEAEQLGQKRGGHSLQVILAEPLAHMRALRFWRVWFEMASAVAVALVIRELLDNIWLAGLVATILMAAIGFVLVGVSPRQLGRVHSNAMVLLTAGAVRFLCLVLGPIPGWLVAIGSAVTPGVQRAETPFFTEDEFRELVDRANEAEMIEDAEAELIHSVFELGDTKVRAVMVPRTDIISIEAGSSLDDAMTLFLHSGCSRMPVIGESADEVLGILYLKDVAALLHGQPARDTQPALEQDRNAQQDRDAEPLPTVEQVCRPVRYVPESKPVADLLRELQREFTHVAIVVDEYGGTAGLVTLEDLIEEIVGEIVDEYDSESPEVQDLGDGRYLVSSRMSVEDLGELFGVDLEDDEVDSVGGLLAKALGQVPIVGSSASVQGIGLRAERREGRRKRVSHLVAWAEPQERGGHNGHNGYNGQDGHGQDRHAQDRHGQGGQNGHDRPAGRNGDAGTAPLPTQTPAQITYTDRAEQ